MSLPKKNSTSRVAAERTKKSRRTITRALRATAYHEAGHAVALWVQGIGFKSASCVPDHASDTVGRVVTRGHPKWFKPDADAPPKARHYAEKELLVNFAGQIAEAKFRGKPPRSGMWQDNQTAFGLALRLFSSQETTEAFMRYVFSLSRDFIAAHWWAVTAVAEELVVRREMKHAEVVEVIRRAIPVTPVQV